MMRRFLQHLVADRLLLQIDAYTWHRYRRIAPFLLGGPIHSLNVGTGGGVETLRLLALGNHVTTVEIDEPTARRTRERIERCGFGARHVGVTGHLLEVELAGPFQQILMSEVLEHIMDDRGALRRLSAWLDGKGRLILSTPTAAHGVLPGDKLSAVEDGGHVRAGYDGPELDALLAEAGLETTQRVYHSGSAVARQHVLERRLRGPRILRPFGVAMGLLSRPFMGALDAVLSNPTDQITIATKKA